MMQDIETALQGMSINDARQLMDTEERQPAMNEPEYEKLFSDVSRMEKTDNLLLFVRVGNNFEMYMFPHNCHYGIYTAHNVARLYNMQYRLRTPNMMWSSENPLVLKFGIELANQLFVNIVSNLGIRIAVYDKDNYYMYKGGHIDKRVEIDREKCNEIVSLLMRITEGMISVKI